MNEVLIHIGWILILMKVVALLLFVWLANDSLRSLICGRPKNLPKIEFEHSFFIYICVALAFSVAGTFIGDLILDLGMGVQAKRQVFYIYFSIHEALFMVTVLQWHNLKRCEFARITTYGFYISVTIMMLFLFRYVDRVIFDADILRGIYSQVVALSNLLITLIFICYPVQRLHQLIVEKFIRKRINQ
ncbi:hypothetical protein HG263_08405 [Pseudoalteromonas sp. JBTF-M23]|uniref:Uncharacterized protein n=1 Tax=Pseudoalteromonas caenipelagi TaxID=2726988 RepID=A0A849VFS4_9GAMM|nr:hypothetical protein [Pseudoalteromonas caenipelagi]NOU50561.1 hypothetical protein [Pseudoalteromonas caenipelagi]